MTRDCFFKAKRDDWQSLPKENWWIKGYHFCMIDYYVNRVRHFIIPIGINCNSELHKEEMWEEVVLETISQIIGLSDKNNKQLCENDIIRYNNKLFKIVWVPECAHFAAHPLQENNWSPCINTGTIQTTEIIGNIFDNYELLEAAK